MKRLRDRLNHEYWPWYLIYLPVFMIYVVEVLRSRRAAFFTNVNPGIDMGGFFGERKSDIYALLPGTAYPETVLVPAGTTVHDILPLVASKGIQLPLIVKPDVGERGRGVERVVDKTRLVEMLTNATEDLLVQRLAKGEHEYGLMFAREPATGMTELLSITGKRFLQVCGDGQRSIAELLHREYRGSKQVKRLRSSANGGLDRILQSGEVLQVEPIGNHCRGTTFMDAGHLRSPQLEKAISDLFHAVEGVYYGRLDVRTTSEEALKAGIFEVIELNGVSSEPGHIYDPSYSIWRCWRELIHHVQRAVRISRELKTGGVEPVPLRKVLDRCAQHFGWWPSSRLHMRSPGARTFGSSAMAVPTEGS